MKCHETTANKVIVKVIIQCLNAVNPNGAACFISDLFESSIIDMDICDQCGIFQQINPGDALLVEKGFTVQYLLLTKEAAIFIPHTLPQYPG